MKWPIDNHTRRELNDSEEREFERARREYVPPVQRELVYEERGYAVMVRVRLHDKWIWETLMRFDTYEEASAHARKGNKVVAFGSAEWRALHAQSEPALPRPAVVAGTGQPFQLPGESFFEFVMRRVPLESGEIRFQDGEKKVLAQRTAARGETFVESVLTWIHEWELKVLRSACKVLASATILVLTRRRHLEKAAQSRVAPPPNSSK